MNLNLDVWSDIACPWCYVGKRRLEKAIALLGDTADITLTWHSFELDSRAPASYGDGPSYVQRLARKYGRSDAQAQEMIDSMVQTAAGEGLTFRFDHIQAGNTFDAHRLLHWALSQQQEHPGVQNALKERLMAAYLGEGAQMSDHETLARLAGEVGLDSDGAKQTLSSDQYATDVREDEAVAASFGARGVPFFVVDRRFGVVGAQSPEELVAVMRRALSDAKPSIVAEGAVCTPDGCD